MILKLKVKRNKKKSLVAWIQKDKDFDDNISQVFRFFEDQIKISKLSRFTRYYIVSSENPAVILSLFSTLQDLIPETYFNIEEPVEIGDLSSS